MVSIAGDPSCLMDCGILNLERSTPISTETSRFSKMPLQQNSHWTPSSACSSTFFLLLYLLSLLCTVCVILPCLTYCAATGLDWEWKLWKKECGATVGPLCSTVCRSRSSGRSRSAVDFKWIMLMALRLAIMDKNMPSLLRSNNFHFRIITRWFCLTSSSHSAQAAISSLLRAAVGTFSEFTDWGKKHYNMSFKLISVRSGYFPQLFLFLTCSMKPTFELQGILVWFRWGRQCTWHPLTVQAVNVLFAIQSNLHLGAGRLKTS